MSNDLVLVEVGVCPICDAVCQATDGLQGYSCARKHEAARYELVDTYAMDARKAWTD